MSKVVNIFICARKGRKMRPLQSVRLITGSGIEGDRYAVQDGAFSKARSSLGQISLIAIEAINEANTRLEKPFMSAETRRNFVTAGVNLNSLVGKEFYVGEAKVYGTELAEPCNRPSRLSKKEGFREAFELRGGLRAQVLSDGVVAIGDPIKVS